MLPDAAGSFDEPAALIPIGAVVTGMQDAYPDVTHSSLRFLEREGLITSIRTRGGHRLYSPADVERIRQIKTWQAQRLSLEEIRQRLLGLDRLPPPSVLADSFLRQALGGDLVAAYQTIIAADDVGLPLARLFGEVLQPALTELGRRWEHGELLVAQEKEVSELARDLIADLSLRHARTPADGPALVAACVEGERHELGLRMICGLFRAEGWAVHYLGADVAPRFLLEAVQLHRPAVILLSAKLALNLPAVKDAIEVLTAGLAPEHPPPIIVGGQIAVEQPEALQAWGAIPVTSAHPAAAVTAVTSLLEPSTAVIVSADKREN
ncbi:MAG: Methionine synthase B12-binding module cap domain protein [Thermomicrobiales bacterium]|nr:Methionine synthase B12-binding module cap domain protein [Thermomicrobiales bacterium]